MKKSIACLAIVLAVGVGVVSYLLWQINISIKQLNEVAATAAALPASDQCPTQAVIFVGGTGSTQTDDMNNWLTTTFPGLQYQYISLDNGGGANPIPQAQIDNIVTSIQSDLNNGDSVLLVGHSLGAVVSQIFVDTIFNSNPNITFIPVDPPTWTGMLGNSWFSAFVGFMAKLTNKDAALIQQAESSVTSNPNYINWTSGSTQPACNHTPFDPACASNAQAQQELVGLTNAIVAKLKLCLTVKVTDASNASPVFGATVTLTDSKTAYPGTSISGTTDANGIVRWLNNFVFQHTYSIVSQKTGYATSTTSYASIQNTTNSGGSGLLLITYLQAVSSATGQGIDNATITLTGGDLTSPKVITTNSNATYTVTGLTLGKTYNVSITAPGYQNLTSTAGVWNPGEVGKYTMTPTVIYLQVTSSATGQGITNATLTLTGGDLTSPMVITKNGNATYTVTGLTLGTYTVTGLTLGKVYNVSVTAPGYTTVTSTAGVWSNGEVGKYVLTPVITTYFQVTDQSTGQGITNATITLTGGDLTSPKVITTNSNATYTVTGLTLGKTYNVSITAPSYVTVTSTAGIWSQGEVAKYAMTQVATPIYSTGVDNSGNLLANGTVDLHWTVNGGHAYVLNVSSNLTCLLSYPSNFGPCPSAVSSGGPGLGSYFISPSMGITTPGTYSFSTKFSIPATANLSTFKIGDAEIETTGGATVSSISLNSTPIQFGPPFRDGYSSFSELKSYGSSYATTGFVHGTNTLTFVVMVAYSSLLSALNVGINYATVPFVSQGGSSGSPSSQYPINCEVPYYPAGVTGTPWAWYIDVIPSQGAAPIQGQQQTTNPGLPLCSSY